MIGFKVQSSAKGRISYKVGNCYVAAGPTSFREHPIPSPPSPHHPKTPFRIPDKIGGKSSLFYYINTTHT